MSTFPLAQTVGLLPYQPMGKNRHGNETAGWGDPVTLRVYAWAIVNATEAPETNRDETATYAEVYGPADMVVGPRDRMLLGDDLYEVVGHSRDYNHGPFGWKPGVVVNLRRVEG